MELLQQIDDKRQEFIKIVEAKAKKAREFSEQLLVALASLREEIPDAVGIAWRQYIPYFNDGDPCTFSLDELRIVFPLGHDVSEDGYYDDLEECYFNGLGDYVSFTISYEATHFKSFNEIERIINDNSELCEYLFGSRAEIFINKEGKIVAEEIEAPY